MLPGFSIVDFATLAFCLALLLVIGSYFSSQQRSSREFMLAGRSFGWLPLGLSLAATTLPAFGLFLLPRIAYGSGLKPIVISIAAWFTALVMLPFAIPLIRKLEVVSIYEFLELRFSAAVRQSALGVFVVWRLLLAGCILYLPCNMLGAMFHGTAAIPAFLLGGGALATFYTYLGGLRAVVWTDVAGIGLILVALLLTILSSWSQIGHGQATVWETAEQLQRATAIQFIAEEGSNWMAEPWLIWIALPSMFVWLLSFYLTDQTTAQRYLAARDTAEAKRAFLANCVAVSILIPLACYVGLCTLAYFKDHTENLRPYWVVNAATEPGSDALLKDPRTGEARIRPDIDFSQQLDALVAAGAILDPNTNEPVSDATIFRDAEGNLDASRLATIDPIPNTPAFEVRLRRGHDQLLPMFLAAILPPGVLGLMFGALLIVALAAFDSNIHAASTLAYSELYERLGWGRKPLASFRQKTPQQLDASDELWLVRGLVLILGAIAIVIALGLSATPGVIPAALGSVVTLGGPLLAIFLLGLFTRHTTAAAAQAALILGTIVALLMSVWVAASGKPDRTLFFTQIWPITVSCSVSLVFGYLASFVVGQHKTREELQGLVCGTGKLGVRPESIEEAIDEDDSSLSSRWR